MVEGYVSQCVVAPAINMHAIVMRQTVDVGSAFVHESGQCDHWCGHTPQSAHTHTHTHTHTRVSPTITPQLEPVDAWAVTRTHTHILIHIHTHIHTLTNTTTLIVTL